MAMFSTSAAWPLNRNIVMKDKLIFLAEVAVAVAAIYAFQKHVYKLPVVGAYLPGGQ